MEENERLEIEKNAEKGDAKAQYELGKLYFYGHEIPVDKNKAREWFRKAADGWNQDAKDHLRAKSRLITICIFVGIGLIIGLGVGISGASYEMGSLIGALLGIWFGVGIPGNLFVEIFQNTSDYRYAYREARKRGESVGSSLGTTLIMGVIFLLLKSIAGPVFPIITIVGYVNDMRYP